MRSDGAPDNAVDRTTAFTYYARGGLRSVEAPDPMWPTSPLSVTPPTRPTASDRTGMPGLVTDALAKTEVCVSTPSFGLVARLVDRDAKVSTYGDSERDKLLAATDPGRRRRLHLVTTCPSCAHPAAGTRASSASHPTPPPPTKHTLAGSPPGNLRTSFGHRDGRVEVVQIRAMRARTLL